MRALAPTCELGGASDAAGHNSVLGTHLGARPCASPEAFSPQVGLHLQTSTGTPRLAYHHPILAPPPREDAARKRASVQTHAL